MFCCRLIRLPFRRHFCHTPAAIYAIFAAYYATLPITIFHAASYACLIFAADDSRLMMMLILRYFDIFAT